MTNQDSDEDWADADTEDGPDVQTNPEETPSEARIIRELAARGVGFRHIKGDSLIFTPNTRWNGVASREIHIPRNYSKEILTQLEKGARHCEKWVGIAVPKEGYIEVLVRPNHTASMPMSYTLRTFERLISNDIDKECHRTQSFHNLPSLDFPPYSTGERKARIGLHGDDACIQISGPSLTCHALCNVGVREIPRFVLSIRICFNQGTTLEQLESKAEPLINSLLYELDVRNHINLRPVTWPSQAERRMPRTREQPAQIVRFPETRIEPEISVLFRFAGSASGNPPLAFLSYYQVLENFFPVAGRRSALRQLELELSDPCFDRRQDKYLMRLLSLGEKTAIASEANQLRILLEEFVRGSKLHDFFGENNWGKHFTKNGPIGGVSDNINPDNRQTPLSHQVADRVYRIRNRIVHAKDDPKYGNMPALLPQSHEAEALGPDIELVRFLAYEVILSTQTRGT
ncbi:MULTISPECIES: hypothetical protein [Streptomyces]|uniref:hypothetical protein n=1 Tax=Streptomyces TaxID=1883 RepID=UPI00163C59EF|nr:MULTISPECIES: hypothetical protein [Streptomyces]MBC2877841.1 hypothetical protein [Streptomyces sp. TYQ1024]UBI37979.1 hypothetical protein K7I03_16875 [Streptomyces mobaraensis]UKW30567.1 hypothetical protein MCU78_16835 [Streptomyces sp. TYQ1024]